MKKLFLITAIALGGLSFQACNSNQQASNNTEDTVDSLNDQPYVATTDDGSEFLAETASSGMMEVELGKLAEEKAVNTKVKSYGAMMASDHTNASEELKTLAASKNVTLPGVPLKDDQDKIDDLKGKSGSDFDKAYINLMVDGHQKTIDSFEDATEQDKDPEVKAFAAKLLPTLRTHLESAKAIKDALR